MKYIHCLWIHTYVDEPVVLVSEIDDQGFETRKVEIWRSGNVGWADEGRTFGETELSVSALDSVEEINSDPQFSAVEISREEFENFWKLIAKDHV